MELNTSKDFELYIKNLNYFVLYPDKTFKFYKSLRDITKDIFVDSSTISKKLKESDYCYVTSRVNNFMFYVRKMEF